MKESENPIQSLKATIAFSNRDWSLDPQDAWVYGIVVGWDDAAMAELKRKFNWTGSTVARLKRLHDKLTKANPNGLRTASRELD